MDDSGVIMTQYGSSTFYLNWIMENRNELEQIYLTPNEAKYALKTPHIISA